MGWNYLSIPKLQRCNRWSLGMDKVFHLTLYWTYDYLSMLGFKLNHVSKRDPRGYINTIQCTRLNFGLKRWISMLLFCIIWYIRYLMKLVTQATWWRAFEANEAHCLIIQEGYPHAGLLACRISANVCNGITHHQPDMLSFFKVAATHWKVKWEYFPFIVTLFSIKP